MSSDGKVFLFSHLGYRNWTQRRQRTDSRDRRSWSQKISKVGRQGKSIPAFNFVRVVSKRNKGFISPLENGSANLLKTSEIIGIVRIETTVKIKIELVKDERIADAQ